MGKVCKICLVSKEDADFHYRRDSGKYRNECKLCFNADRKVPNKQYKTGDKYKKWKAGYDREYKNTDAYKKYQRIFSRSEVGKKVYSRSALIKYWPGLSGKEAEAEYDKLLEKSGNRCSICKNPETHVRSGKVRRLSIDHCHSTGVVRGLLCSFCNSGIGMFFDNTDTLKEAIRYLEESAICENQES